jgi:tetratricopeptide (TPR) repeat protein
MFRAVLTDSSRILGDEHPHTLLTMSCLGVAYGEMGDLTQAIMFTEQAAAGQRRLAAPASIYLAETLKWLAELYTLSGRADDALAAESERVQFLEEVLPRANLSVIEARELLADRYTHAARRHEAARLLARNLADLKHAYGDRAEVVRLAAERLAAVRQPLLPLDCAGGLAGDV